MRPCKANDGEKVVCTFLEAVLCVNSIVSAGHTLPTQKLEWISCTKMHAGQCGKFRLPADVPSLSCGLEMSINGPRANFNIADLPEFAPVLNDAHIQKTPLRICTANFVFCRSALILYRGILDRIEANGYDNFTKRAYVPKWQKSLALPAAFVRSQYAPQFGKALERASGGQVNVVLFMLACVRPSGSAALFSSDFSCRMFSGVLSVY